MFHEFCGKLNSTEFVENVLFANSSTVENIFPQILCETGFYCGIDELMGDTFPWILWKLKSTEFMENALSTNSSEEWKIFSYKFYGKQDSTVNEWMMEDTWILWKTEVHRIYGKYISVEFGLPGPGIDEFIFKSFFRCNSSTNGRPNSTRIL